MNDGDACLKTDLKKTLKIWEINAGGSIDIYP